MLKRVQAQKGKAIKRPVGRPSKPRNPLGRPQDLKTKPKVAPPIAMSLRPRES